jgi:hypothetical protein
VSFISLQHRRTNRSLSRNLWSQRKQSIPSSVLRANASLSSIICASCSRCSWCSIMRQSPTPTFLSGITPSRPGILPARFSTFWSSSIKRFHGFLLFDSRLLRSGIVRPSGRTGIPEASIDQAREPTTGSHLTAQADSDGGPLPQDLCDDRRARGRSAVMVALPGDMGSGPVVVCRSLARLFRSLRAVLQVLRWGCGDLVVRATTGRRVGSW